MAEDMEKTAGQPTKKPAKKKEKKENRIGKFFRDLKSEMKKITWYSAHDTIQNSIWTVVALAVLTVLIGGVNWAFSSIIALIGG